MGELGHAQEFDLVTSISSSMKSSLVVAIADVIGNLKEKDS